jgi:hypothetical protein
MEVKPETNPARKRENEDREVGPITMRFVQEFDPVVQSTLSGSNRAGMKAPKSQGRW